MQPLACLIVLAANVWAAEPAADVRNTGLGVGSFVGPNSAAGANGAVRLHPEWASAIDLTVGVGVAYARDQADGFFQGFPYRSESTNFSVGASLGLGGRWAVHEGVDVVLGTGFGLSRRTQSSSVVTDFGDNETTSEAEWTSISVGAGLDVGVGTVLWIGARTTWTLDVYIAPVAWTWDPERDLSSVVVSAVPGLRTWFHFY